MYDKDEEVLVIVESDDGALHYLLPRDSDEAELARTLAPKHLDADKIQLTQKDLQDVLKLDSLLGNWAPLEESTNSANIKEIIFFYSE